jgi:hypothetical protein
MSCPRTDAIRRHLLAGGELGRDDARHVASCAACQRAAGEVDRLDARLREAARPLATEPLPDEVLDVEPMGVERGALIGAGLGAVAAGLAAVLVVLVAIGQLRPTAVDPSLSPSPSTSASVAPSPSAEPSSSEAPSPSAAPTPGVTETSPWLVAPSGACADGSAGFSVFLPEGWYASRRSGEQPACRTVGRVRVVEGRQIMDPSIYLGVLDEEPTFEGTTIEDRQERTSQAGIPMARLVVRTDEVGAVAASHATTYVAPLLHGRFLMASTDADDADAVEALDALMDRLEVREPIEVAPVAVAEATRLFHDRDVCQDPDRGLSVVFPDSWWTNTATDDLVACSWFAPTSFAVVSGDVVPDEVEITVSLFPGDVGTFGEVVAWDSVTVMERPATRWILGDEAGRTYQYVIQLGPIAETGPTLVASTTAEPGDVDLAMAVLDGIVARMTLADPPPGATSDAAPITAPAVSATVDGDGFRLGLVVEQDRYRAGQPILADATLTWLGPAPSVRVFGSGSGIVFTGVRQLDGPVDPGMGATSDCVPYDIVADDPLVHAFGKSGGFGGDDPLAAWYEAYFRDPLLRLPPGRWEVWARASGTVGGEDCGDGPGLGLSVRVEIVVEP